MVNVTLDTRVEIQAPVTSQSASGAEIRSWTAPTIVGTRWAEIKTGSGKELVIARQTAPEVDTIISMRGYLAITPSMRVAHADGRLWDIVSVLTRDSKSPVKAGIIDLHCRTGVGAY